jgi:hypothetical protein
VEAADVSLIDYLDETGTLVELTGTQKYTFINNVGHSPAAMHDIAIMERKVQDCFDEMAENLRGNRAEFGNVIAYTYALLAAKLILGYLGLFIIKSRGTNYLIDFAPQFGKHSFAKIYKTAALELENPVKIVSLGNRDINHKSIWQMVCALARKKAITVDATLNSWLSKFDYSRSEIVRNKILYTSSFWPDESKRPHLSGDPQALMKAITEISPTENAISYADYNLAQKCSQILAHVRVT